MAEIPDIYEELDLKAIESQIAARAAQPTAQMSDMEDFGDLGDLGDFKDFGDLDDYGNFRDDHSAFTYDEFEKLRSEGSIKIDSPSTEWDGFPLETDECRPVSPPTFDWVKSFHHSPTRQSLHESDFNNEFEEKIYSLVNTRLEEMENKIERFSDILESHVSEFQESTEDTSNRLEKIESMLTLIYSKLMD